jgi:hypothetical protein
MQTMEVRKGWFLIVGAAVLLLLVIALGGAAWADPSGRATDMGALGAIGGGVAGALALGYLEQRRADRQRLEAHKAAVVAVLMELGANVVVSQQAGPAWWIRGLAWRWSHSVHDQMATAFYSVDLPFSVARSVGTAYAAIRATKRPDDTAVEDFRDAYDALVKHAISLGVVTDADIKAAAWRKAERDVMSGEVRKGKQ